MTEILIFPIIREMNKIYGQFGWESPFIKYWAHSDFKKTHNESFVLENDDIVNMFWQLKQYPAVKRLLLSGKFGKK